MALVRDLTCPKYTRMHILEFTMSTMLISVEFRISAYHSLLVIFYILKGGVHKTVTAKEISHKEHIFNSTWLFTVPKVPSVLVYKVVTCRFRIKTKMFRKFY